MKLTKITFILLLLSTELNGQLIPFRVNFKWGYSNPKGEMIIQPQYAFCDFFQDSVAFVIKDSSSYAINTKGEIISEPLKRYGNFINGLCPVQLRNGKSVYINQSGKIVIDKGFSAAENFSEGLAVVSLGSKLGIINTKGEWIRQPDFDTSSIYYKSGFLLGLSKGKYFFIDRNGKNFHLPDSISPAGIFSEGLAPVFVTKSYNSTGQKVKTTFLEFIDTTGKIALSGFINDGVDYSEYITIEKEFRDGKAIIKSRNDLAWDYFFIDKKKSFSPLYSVARQLGDSLFLGVIGYYMSDVRILDSNYYVAGQFQSKPTQVGEFGNGLVPFRDKDGNWGYYDENCRLIIPNKYSAAFTFKNGYAYVVLNGKQGVIDSKGKEFFIDK